MPTFQAISFRNREYIGNHDAIPDVTDDEKEEYEVAEHYVYRTLKRMIKILFAVNRPSVLYMTTSSLLNSTARSVIFKSYIPSFITVIGDGASQVSEPAVLTIGGCLSHARHVYIGGIHQLAPHVKCPPNSNPALHGAPSVMSLLLDSPVVTVAPLVITFRSHPALIALRNVIAYDGALMSGTIAQARRLLLSRMCFSRLTSRLCSSTQGEQPSEPPDGLDSVQGREKKVVILLTTKTKLAQDPDDEFINEYRRLNVTLFVPTWPVYLGPCCLPPPSADEEKVALSLY
ncbi:hypothetical protein V3C99_015470 [Haemonchus contortus]|uniref:Helicase C-terminal domain-containing protein n=1 Tax=Haemonchus contortus TaxID=6289 RepID=A0A7I4YX54_HAECO